MRIHEIFDGCYFIKEGPEETINSAKQVMKLAKQQEKRGQIAKIKDKASQKEKELSKISSNILPIKPKGPK